MGYPVLINEEINAFCFSCSTTEVAFGPLLYLPEGEDAEDASEAFIKFLRIDPRTIGVELIREKWFRFCKKKGWKDHYPE